MDGINRREDDHHQHYRKTTIYYDLFHPLIHRARPDNLDALTSPQYKKPRAIPKAHIFLLLLKVKPRVTSESFHSVGMKDELHFFSFKRIWMHYILLLAFYCELTSYKILGNLSADDDDGSKKSREIHNILVV